MENSSQFIAKLTSWNHPVNQASIRKSLMNDFKGVKKPTSLELKAKADGLMAKIDHGLRQVLDIAVFIEFLKLSIK